MLLLVALLAFTVNPCSDLTWNPSEPGAVYEVRRDGVLLGETSATRFPVGCPSGLFSVVARDAAGNRSLPTVYQEVAFGPCAVGCPIACIDGGRGCEGPFLIPIDACCLAPLERP